MSILTYLIGASYSALLVYYLYLLWKGDKQS